MNHTEHNTQPHTADLVSTNGVPATVPGSCHNQGVPGEDRDVRKRMHLLKIGDRSQRNNNSRPPTSGADAEQGSDARLENGVRVPKWAAGVRLDASRPDFVEDNPATAVYVIAKKDCKFLDTPVFHAGELGDQEAVAVFTGRALAQNYLDCAGWNEIEEVGELSPGDLLKWLTDANREGVRYVTVNPDRNRHLAGDPQAVLSLDALIEEPADSLVRQLTELAQR